MKQITQICMVAIGLWTATALSQDHGADTPVTSIPAGVVPTPAQTHNPMILGIGMLVVGLTMGYVLFGRRTTTTDHSKGDSQ